MNVTVKMVNGNTTRFVNCFDTVKGFGVSLTNGAKVLKEHNVKTQEQATMAYNKVIFDMLRHGFVLA